MEQSLALPGNRREDDLVESIGGLDFKVAMIVLTTLDSS